MSIYSDILSKEYRYTFAEILALDLNTFPPAIQPKYDDDPLPWVFARCDLRGYLPDHNIWTARSKNNYFNHNTGIWEVKMRRRSHYHIDSAKFEVYFYEDDSAIVFDALNLKWVTWDHGQECERPNVA